MHDFEGKNFPHFPFVIPMSGIYHLCATKLKVESSCVVMEDAFHRTTTPFSKLSLGDDLPYTLLPNNITCVTGETSFLFFSELGECDVVYLFMNNNPFHISSVCSFRKSHEVCYFFN